MLPFLEPKKMASVLIAKHTDKGQEPERMSDEASPEMHALAESILSAIASKDSEGLAMALQKICGSK